MVKDNQFKPTFKQPFIPQTETRIFLGGRPIDQRTEQTGSKGISKQHYQSVKVQDINPGYGPGFWDEVGDIVEEIGENIKYTFTQGIKDHKEEIAATALAISYATPAAAITVPATIATGAAGATLWGAGKVTKDERQEEVGKSLMRVAGGALAENGQDFQKETDKYRKK